MTTSEPRALASIVVLGSGGRPAVNHVGFSMRDAYFSIGRDRDNHLCLSDDEAVSRHHCAIEIVGSALVVKDLSSANGTYVNGHRIHRMEPLSLPCSLVTGHTRLAVMQADPPPVEEDFESLIESTFCMTGSIVIPARSKFQQRTEAFLVVDIIGSTKLVQDSDLQLSQIVATLGRSLEHALRAEEEPFLKCTGDGFLACFGSAKTALEAAIHIQPKTASWVSLKPQISVALHWGSASMTTGGDRIGKDVHLVFALEKLRHAEPALLAGLSQPDTRQLILATGAFCQQLDDQDRQQIEPIGTFHLRDLDEPQEVFQWVKPLAS